ncbi:MAG TPA: protein arginine kinase [Clostridiales bacterium]|nr:protein arginine kinase [Clostridiales bacterium]
MEANNENNGVIISSRVRLARNFEEYPFPYRMNKAQADEIISKVRSSIAAGGLNELKGSLFVDMQNFGEIERQMLVEKHLISPDLTMSCEKSAVVISRDEKVSIMINEEDHLRIQAIYSGLKLNDALILCNKIDDCLEKNINYAYSSTYGYLTCCPTNIGTGIRASVMLHLPALVMTGYIRNVLEACSKLNMTVRGIYGEHSGALGNIFQMSNQVSLGQTEEEIVTSITNIATQIVEQENTIRNELYKQNAKLFEDKIYRSFGLLSNARIITTEESLNLISDVKLGVDMGIIKDVNINTVNEIILLIQPASLQKFVGKPISPDERDIKRAELIREKLKASQ